MEPKHSSIKRENLVLGLIVWTALIAAVVVPQVVPPPPWQPLVEIVRGLTPNPATRALVREFRVPRSETSHRLLVDSDTRKGRFSVIVTGNSNKQQRYDIWPGRRTVEQVYSDPYRLRRGKTYSIRVEEKAFGGSYTVRFYPTAHAATWAETARGARVTVASFALAAFALGLMACCRVIRRAEPPFRRVPLVLLAGFIPMLDTIYGVVHEFGHHIANVCVGSGDFASSDFLGLSGLPYAEWAIGARLADWEYALTFISGPVFPTLAAYALFAGMALIRRRDPRCLTTVWGTGLLMVLLRLLVSQVLFVPLALGIMSDGPYGDYTRFTLSYPGLVLIPNLLMILLALISVWLGVTAVRWAVAQRRKDRAVREAGER